MSSTIAASNCATPPPLPVAGGGAPSPVQSPIQAPQTAVQGANGGGPAQSPMQVPTQPSAVQGAAGGGQLVQPAPAAAAPVAAAPAPVAAAPAPAAAAPAPAAQPAAPVAGGGPTDMSQVIPALQQVVTALTGVVTALQAQLGAGQAQAGATGVQGASGGGAVEGGGAASPVQQSGASGCGCGGGMAEAKGAAGGVDAAPLPEQVSEDKKADKPKDAPKPAAPAAGTGGNGKLDSQDLKVKGKKMDAEQREMAERVLRKGQQMGANKKVLETAVSTMIQEATLHNLHGGDRDSQGLFQQRPSQGWGTVAEVTNPEHAAESFFKKAIANDKKDPGKSKTALAQSVQISGFPNAYAQWDKEAEAIVADFLG